MPAALLAAAFAVGVLATVGAAWLRSTPLSIWLAACAMLVCGGALRYALDAPLPAARSVARYNGQHVILEGVVVDEPDVRPSHTNLRLRPLRIRTAQVTDETLDDLVLVRVKALSDHQSDGEALRSRVQSDYEKWPHGSLVYVEGLLDAPPRLSNFDYREYLARRRVFSWISQPRALAKIGTTPDSQQFYAHLLRFKNTIRQGIWNTLPEKEAALLSGILLGDGQTIPEDLKEDFRRTGTSHLIAISGSNFSILIALPLPLMIRLVGRRQAAMLAMPVIALYAVFVGLEASVVRAAVMASIGLVGMLLWRTGIKLNTLCAAAFILLVTNPHLLFDVGFQLSFSATLGLALYAERSKDWLYARASSRIPQRRVQQVILSAAEIALLTLSTHITTLPIQWLIFESFSSIALVTNLLVVPLQPPLMILGALGAAVAAFGPPPIVAWLAFRPADLLLDTTIRVVQEFAKFQHALLAVPYFSVPAAVAYYAVLLGSTAFLLQPAAVQQAVFRLLWARRTALCVCVAGLTALSLGVILWFQRPDGRLHLTFLGSSAIIRSPASQQAVFLGNGDVVNMLRRTMPVGDGELEVLIVPQRSKRYWQSVHFLLERYRARDLILPPGPDPLIEDMESVWKVVHANATRIVTATDGLMWALDDHVSFTIVLRTPAQDGRQAIGARLSHGEVVIDLVGEQQAIDYPPGAALIFLDWNRADLAALNAASPRWVVWTDGLGVPPLLRTSIHALNLKEMSGATFVSDGHRLVFK